LKRDESSEKTGKVRRDRESNQAKYAKFTRKVRRISSSVPFSLLSPLILFDKTPLLLILVGEKVSLLSYPLGFLCLKSFVELCYKSLNSGSMIPSYEHDPQRRGMVYDSLHDFVLEILKKRSLLFLAP
jgi:hypothetical protein